MIDFRGKRFLITQPVIHELNGSTVVTIELADYLRGHGASVIVYTCYKNDPVARLFNERGIKVVCADEEPKLKLEDFDYVWVHSQVLPISMIQELGGTLPKKLPKFLFYHMSQFEDEIPDEMPWIYDLEHRLSSYSLFVSEETMQAQQKYFAAETKRGVLRNFASEAFANMKYRPAQILKNILIVSNHPPDELLELREIMPRQEGVKVMLSGESKSDIYGLITPEIIEQYDVVITIGKTVQYCLASGVPVFVYDRFGGKGYLNAKNYEGARKVNFSGRDGTKKTAQVLMRDMMHRYGETVSYQAKNRDNFKKEFSIGYVLPRVVNEAEDRKIIKLDKRYVAAVIAAQNLVRWRFELGGWAKSEARTVKNLLSEIAAMRNSMSFRIGMTMTWPLRKLRQVFDIKGKNE